MAVKLSHSSYGRSFQLTHPSRGVAITPHTYKLKCVISTHTPLARCGATIRLVCSILDNFNSHTPREVWLPFAKFINRHVDFNSHTPREVWPKALQTLQQRVRISTHTPLARCGIIVRAFFQNVFHFNSHTPREVWQKRNTFEIVSTLFQLTHPSRGVAGNVVKCVLFTCTISTHTPLARCGGKRLITRNGSNMISTHTPLARCGIDCFTLDRKMCISTHTPLARCGEFGVVNINTQAHFNSHTPREVWRAEESTCPWMYRISTHTPLARCGL